MLVSVCSVPVGSDSVLPNLASTVLLKRMTIFLELESQKSAHHNSNNMADELGRCKRALREKEQEVRMLGSKTKQLLHGMQDEAQERRAAHRDAAHARQRARDKYDDCKEARDLYAQGNERRHHADQRGARLAKQLHESASALKRLHAAHAIERARRKEVEAALARCRTALDLSAADLKRARAEKTKALAGVGAFVVSCSCAVANSMATGKRSTASKTKSIEIETG